MSKARPALRRRSASRLAAVQALYQMELSGASAEAALRDRARRAPDPETEGEAPAELDQIFFGELVRGAGARQADVDAMIEAVLVRGWTLGRLEAVLRAILRAGAFELLSRSDIDAPVTIDEYVEIAKSFFTGNEPKLVNGVLDRLARALHRHEEREEDRGDAGKTH